VGKIARCRRRAESVTKGRWREVAAGAAPSASRSSTWRVPSHPLDVYLLAYALAR